MPFFQNTSTALGLYGGGGGGGGRKPWTSSSSSWLYNDETGGMGYPSAIDRRIGGGTGRQAAALFGSSAVGGALDPHHYRSGARTLTSARSLAGVYDGTSLLYRCSTSNV